MTLCGTRSKGVNEDDRCKAYGSLVEKLYASAGGL